MQYFHFAGPLQEVDIVGEVGAHFVIVDDAIYQKWVKAEAGFQVVRQLDFTHSREKTEPNERHVIDFNDKIKSVNGVAPGCVVPVPPSIIS